MASKYLDLSGLSTLWTKVKAKLATKQDDISGILPTDASATNQLATKAYADAIGERLEARYLGSDASGNPFASRAALESATAYYYQGSPAAPDTNDITTVTSDESHVGTTGEPSTTRYRWNGTGWSFEYVINNTGLSESQLLAVNSGITASKVSGYDGLDSAKLNVSGSNATNAGVTAMLRKVSTGSASLSDESQYFGDSNSDHAKVVRRPVSDILDYVKGKLGSVGGSSKPVYFSNGLPVECDSVEASQVPFTEISSDANVSYGVYLGGATAIGRNTRSNVAFLVSISTTDSLPLRTYLGTFSYRASSGGKLAMELKELNGQSTYPWRIWYADSSTGSGSSATYDVGLWIIPPNKTTTYATVKVTKLHSASFDWTPAACTEETYDILDAYARPPLRFRTLTYSSGGSNVKTTGGTWTSTYNAATAMDAIGVVDLTVTVGINVIKQSTYVATLTNYEVTLVNSAGTEIIDSSKRQSAPMPKATSSSRTVSGCSMHRFVFPITASSNLLAGYRVQVRLPSNYTIDDQVNISVHCQGVIHPYDITY